MRNILPSNDFKEGIRQISIYIRDYFGQQYVKTFIENTESSMRTIAIFPETGKPADGNIYAKHVDKKNWVYYRFNENEINFLFIHDSRRRFDKSKLKKSKL